MKSLLAFGLAFFLPLAALGQNDPRLVPIIGALRMGDFAQAIDALQPLLAKNDVDAQYLMGVAMESIPPPRRDLNAAREWFLKAAANGSAAAKNSLGTMYHAGKGVPKNLNEALRWFREAATEGNPDAQYNLGRSYLEGEGLPKDVVEAARWFRSSAEAGSTWGQLYYGLALQKGVGLQRDLTASFQWLRRSAEGGNKAAMGELAQVYRLGLSVPSDEEEAQRWEARAK